MPCVCGDCLVNRVDFYCPTNYAPRMSGLRNSTLALHTRRELLRIITRVYLCAAHHPTYMRTYTCADTVLTPVVEIIL